MTITIKQKNKNKDYCQYFILFACFEFHDWVHSMTSEFQAFNKPMQVDSVLDQQTKEYELFVQ